MLCSSRLRMFLGPDLALYLCCAAPDIAIQKKERAERAEMKKVRLQERMVEQQKLNQEHARAGQESFKAFSEKRVYPSPSPPVVDPRL